MKNSNALQPITGPLLELQTGIKHGFFTRQGGVSKGIYASLNGGSNSPDKPEHVKENRHLIAQWFGVEDDHFLTPSQYHSNVAIKVDGPWQGKASQGDALVTKTKNLVIGVLTADCGAVILYDPKAHIIGVAHAGWKGALTGILQSTVDAMVEMGAKASNILAVSGPSIGPKNYEVGEDFRHAFLAKDESYARYFTPWTGESHNLFDEKKEDEQVSPTYHCDLWQFIHDRLVEKGVQVEDLNICTYADEKRFYSFRRATHKGEDDYGREVTAVCLT